MLYQKEIREAGHYDIIVIGGGPSGVCAAIEASRAGARVLLAEASGMLGGMATLGLVGPLMTSYNGKGERPVVGGLFREIIDRLSQYENAVIPPEETDAPSIYTSFIGAYHKHVTPLDTFCLQVVLDEMVCESGAEVLLYTNYTDCTVENGKIKDLIFTTPEGLLSLSADICIDCSGNAALAVDAGVPAYSGDEETGIPQPGTLMFEVSGVDDRKFEAFAARPPRPVKVYKMPQAGRYKVNHYHVYNVNAVNAKQMTDAHMQARGQVLEALRVLRQTTPGFEHAELVQVAPMFGVRESRHIRGLYTLTAEDISAGTRFDDTVAAYAFGMDVHNRRPEEKGNFKIPTADVYYIPYRSLVPLGCDNLLVAGKTISCESQAAGAIRVMPCAMALGQAAGLAAAMCIRAACPPRAIDTNTLTMTLAEHGAILR